MTLRLFVEYPVGGGRRPLAVESEPLAVGGEAAVHTVLTARPEAVAKVYHCGAPGQAAARRREPTVRELVQRPPPDRPAAPGHVTCVWPRFLLYHEDGTFAGFVMARVNGLRPLDEFLLVNKRDPSPPAGCAPPLSRTLGLAANLAAAVAGLHDDGFVRLELSGTNVLVDSRLLVTLIDTDSYLRTCSGAPDDAPALVTPDFAPPEVLRNPAVRWSRSQDEYALAVLIFNLLVGTHPFHGKHLGAGVRPPLDDAVAAGLWPYDPAAAGRVRPSVHAAPPEVLTPELWELCHRCFVGGNRLPAVRPGARAWSAALNRAAASEMWGCRQCGREFYVELPGCPWCRAASGPTAV